MFEIRPRETDLAVRFAGAFGASAYPGVKAIDLVKIVDASGGAYSPAFAYGCTKSSWNTDGKCSLDRNGRDIETQIVQAGGALSAAPKIIAAIRALGDVAMASFGTDPSSFDRFMGDFQSLLSGLASQFSDYTNGKTTNLRLSAKQLLFFMPPVGGDQVAVSVWGPFEWFRGQRLPGSNEAGGVSDALGIMFTLAGNLYPANHNRKLFDLVEAMNGAQALAEGSAASPPPSTPALVKPPYPTGAIAIKDSASGLYNIFVPEGTTAGQRQIETSRYSMMKLSGPLRGDGLIIARKGVLGGDSIRSFGDPVAPAGMSYYGQAADASGAADMTGKVILPMQLTPSTTAASSGMPTWAWIAIGTGVVAAAGGITYAIVKKKRR